MNLVDMKTTQQSFFNKIFLKFKPGTLKSKVVLQKSKKYASYSIVYYLLVLISFVFLYPIFYMITYSLMNVSDLVNPLINWIPSQLYIGNYIAAAQVLNFFPALLETLYVTAVPAIVQTAAASVIGYGFARFRIPGKKLLIALVLFTFVIPPQVTMIPQFLMYRDLGLIGSTLSFILPAMLGQGIRSTIFILIFYQFYRNVPKSLEEAAKIDGSNALGVFLFIAIPAVVPAFIISFLFSFVWYWNETTLASIYFGDSISTLLMRLQRFSILYERLRSADPNFQVGRHINEAINMAGTLLNILPLLIVYFFTQRWFVESIDRTGITGE